MDSYGDKPIRTLWHVSDMLDLYPFKSLLFLVGFDFFIILKYKVARGVKQFHNFYVKLISIFQNYPFLFVSYVN